MPARQSNVLFASLAFAAASASAAQAATWQTHRYETDGFTIEFSGDVLTKPIDVNTDTLNQMVRTTSYIQDGGNTYAYIVGASLFKPDAGFDFEAGVKGTMDSYKCAVIGSDTSPAGIGDRAREIHASKCSGGTIRVGAKFFIVGKWFYQIAYLIAPAANAADAEHFLRSFKLIAK